jgi:hypothetical protein
MDTISHAASRVGLFVGLIYSFSIVGCVVIFGASMIWERLNGARNGQSMEEA